MDDVWDCDVSGLSETESSRVEDDQRYALSATALDSSAVTSTDLKRLWGGVVLISQPFLHVI